MYLVRNIVRKYHYDYVICGGASAGLCLANTIAQNKILDGKKLLLLEQHKGLDINIAHKFPQTTNRVLCTNPKSVELFKNLGIWDELEKTGVHASTRIEIWDEYAGLLEFKPITNGYNLCYMIDNIILQTLLFKKFLGYISKKKHDMKLNTSIHSMKTYKENGKDIIELVLTDKSKITTDLLIGCDGALSYVRDLVGISTWKHDYNMTLHVGTAKHPHGIKDDFTFKKFTSNGYIAFLPLGSGMTSYAWCVNDPVGEQFTQMNSQELVQQMNQYLAKKCDMPSIYSYGKSLFDNIRMGLKPGIYGSNMFDFDYRPLSVESIIQESRYCFPLRIIFSKQFVKDNVVLVGDAAHRINPITAQGLNLGFKDIVELTKILENTHLLGYGNYHPKLLQRYDKYRKIDAGLHVAFGTITNYAFANDIKSLTFCRSLGLCVANKFPYKNDIVHRITC